MTNNATAIQNTFNYAAANHCTALIPAGTFAYSGNVTATGVAVAGNGASSILKPANFANSALIPTGTGGSISNLSMTSAATTRLSTPWSAMIWTSNATNFIVQNVLIHGSPTFAGNYVDNPDLYADIYIAPEDFWNTQSVANVTVTGNTLVDGGPNQGSALIYNGQGALNFTITGVTISVNQFVNPKLGALQFTGNGSVTGIVVQNNTDYSTSAFSFSSNPTASPNQSGNQVLAPSTYTTPLVSPGGGCSFAGC